MGKEECHQGSSGIRRDEKGARDNNVDGLLMVREICLGLRNEGEEEVRKKFAGAPD